MIMFAYTIFDRKSLQYHPPFYAVTPAAAVRSFSELANDASSMIGRHPSDFVLFRCGAFDDQKGELINLSPLEHVADAVSLVSHGTPDMFDRLRRTDTVKEEV